MAPSTEKIQAALEAMRSDARGWNESAGELSSATFTASWLNLDAQDFSYLANERSLTELYSELQNKIVTLLSQGQQNFESISTQMSAAADSYEAEEEAGVHRMRNIY